MERNRERKDIQGVERGYQKDEGENKRVKKGRRGGERLLEKILAEGRGDIGYDGK